MNPHTLQYGISLGSHGLPHLHHLHLRCRLSSLRRGYLRFPQSKNHVVFLLPELGCLRPLETTYSRAMKMPIWSNISIAPCPAPCSSVALISANLVSKEYQSELTEDALTAMEIARGLGLHVPSVKRVVLFEGTAYLIMESIHGATLEGNLAKARMDPVAEDRPATPSRHPQVALHNFLRREVSRTRKMHVLLARWPLWLTAKGKPSGTGIAHLILDHFCRPANSYRCR